MNNSIGYFMGFLALIIAASLIADAANENSNSSASSDSISLNMTQGNTTMNRSALNSSLNNIVTNTSANERIGLANDIGINAASEIRVSQSESSNGIAFQIGSGLRGNGSAFKTGVAARPIKNASKMWYLIQGVPHGYT